MSIKNNTALLQEIKDMISDLPNVNDILPDIKVVAGTLTTVKYDDYNGYFEVYCGFKPDIVCITDGTTFLNAASIETLNVASFNFDVSQQLCLYSILRIDDGSCEIYAGREDNELTGLKDGFWGVVVYRDTSFNASAYIGDLNYIAVKYTDITTASKGVHLPTLANEGSAADLLAGKQLVDSNGNVVFGSLVPNTSTVETTTTKLSSNSTTITFAGLTGEPKMFSIHPTGNITLGSTRYVTNVTYDGTTTHGVYGYRSSSSGTSYYSSSYFTWTYSNGTLTVKTNSSTNGGNFSSSATYQLTYIA